MSRSNVVSFVQGFRRKPFDLLEDSNALLIRQLACVALKTANKPIPLRKLYNSIVSEKGCGFKVRYDFFVASLCTRMKETGIIIIANDVMLL